MCGYLSCSSVSDEVLLPLRPNSRIIKLQTWLRIEVWYFLLLVMLFKISQLLTSKVEVKECLLKNDRQSFSSVTEHGTLLE